MPDSGEAMSKMPDCPCNRLPLCVGPDISSGAGDIRLSDDSSVFVLLTDTVPDAILEIRYYSTCNIIGDRIEGCEQPIALLTKEAAVALKAVSDDVVRQGYRINKPQTPEIGGFSFAAKKPQSLAAQGSCGWRGSNPHAG